MMTQVFRSIAHCESCDGYWWVVDTHPYYALEGVCQECQADSDTEKPLSFHPLLDLPKGWINEE